MSCPICFSTYNQLGSNDPALTEKKQLKCLHSVCAGCFKQENFICPTCIDNEVSRMGLKTADSVQAQAARVGESFAAVISEVKEMGTLNGDER